MKRFLQKTMHNLVSKSVFTVMFFALMLSSVMQAQSNRTVAFTGTITDFQAAERFVSNNSAITYAMAFDATYMYFGVFNTTGNFGGASDNFAIYLDTDPRNTPASGNGTTAGRPYQLVTPTLPFNADYSSYTEQSYTDPLNRFNAGWASAGVTPTTFTSANCREVRIALKDLGNPSSVYVTMWMGYGSGLFANAPGSAVTASTTPTITGYFGSFPVYKSGVQPISFRAQDIVSASGGGTPIPNLSVTANTTVNGDYGDVTISGAFTWTLNGNSSFSGTCAVGSGTTNASKIDLATFGLNVGGRGIGGTAGVLSLNGSSGTVLQSTTSTLNFLGSGSINGANTTKLMPSGLTMTLGGAVDFFASGTVPVNFGSGSALQINPNGSVVTNAPLYNVASTLIYNTGGTYGASTEWLPNIITGAGYPGKVTIQNNTAVNFGAATTFRQLSGLLTIGSGSSLTLSSVSGGDLRIAGGLTNNNTGSGVGINTNGRAVQSMGTGTYTKAGTDNLDFLIIGSANTLTLATGTNLNLTNTNASGALQFNAAGTLAMAGTNTVTLAAGTTVAGTTAGTISGSTPTTSILNLAGACTWAGTAATVVSVATTVGIQVNAGLTITTAGRLSAGYLQINPGGFIGGTNPVVYPASGTLVYNHSSGTYGVQALEFPAASGPTNLTVNANGASTGISFATNNITARTLTGTLTINHDVDLSGAGPAALTALNVVANATALVKGSGNFTLSAPGSFTTANVGGINGTLSTSGTKTLPALGASVTFNNATSSQVTGTLLPASVAAFTMNNPTAATGTTISNNTLTITGATTLTAGALVLPTGAGNLVTFSGAIAGTTGTLTGSTTSNIVTSTLTSPFNLAFTAGGQALNNWNKGTSTFGSVTPQGLSSPVSISGTFTQAGAGDFYTTSTGGLTILSGGTYDQQANGWYLGAGSINISSGATFKVNDSGGFNATSTTSGVTRATGTRTFSGGANYTFNNASTQAIGDALDAAGGTGKTGVITGNVVVNGTATNLTLNTGTTVTINTPGSFTLGSATSAATLTAGATSIINGSGNVTFLGNGATLGSTLITAHANGVNGTFPGTGTFSLTNGANNNTNFTFNGTVAQVTGSLMPAIVNNLSFSNTFSGALATPSVTLSSSVIANGTTTTTGISPIGVVSIGAGNSLTLNGAITTTANKFIGTATSNLTIGGSGAISAVGLFLSGGGVLNNFTMNRTTITATIGTPLTVSGIFSATAGVIAMGVNTLTLNGPIALGAATLTSTGPFAIGGAGAITGSLIGTLTFSGITMNRTGATLPLGSNASVSNTTGLTLTAGNIALGAFNLTSTSATGQLGAGSSTSMVVATGAGQAFNTVPITGFIAQTFPIGDGTNYTPVVLTFSANATGGTVGVKTVASVHPNLNTGSTPVAYTSRYWTFTNTLGATYAYSGTFRYISLGDVTGTESNLKLSRWSGSAWAEYAGSSVASPVLSSGSLTQATSPLTFDYTGRVNTTAIDYVWSGTTNDWNTAGNWTPNGVPTGVDNVTIDGSLSAVLCSINSSTYTVNNFTLNGTGSFAMASTTSLIVSGNLTYGGTATATLDCASTINIASSSAQTVPALNFGNLNLTGGNRTLAATGTIGICGTYTPGAGTITTTGSTIDFNGIALQIIPATNYNNLTSSSTGLRTLANAGTITVAGTFTPGSNTFTVSGSTVALTATSGTIAVTLPTVGSGNSFNILTINGTGGTFGLPYSATTQNLATTLNVTAGTFVLNPASSTLANTVAVGTININGGTLDDRSTVSGLSTTLQVSTAWNQSSGVVTNTGTGVDRIQFTGGGATTFTGLTAAASFQYFTVQVTNNTTTTLASALTVNNITGTNLIVDLGSTLNASTFVVNTNATGNSMSINGTFKTANTAGFSGAAATAISATFTPTITLGAASTVEYTSTGTASITGRSDYANLTVSGSGTYTFGAATVLSLNYSQTAGVVNFVNGASAFTMTVGGTFTQSAGTFNVTGSAATAGATITVTGATSIGGAFGMEANSANTASTVLFQANGNATFGTAASFNWMAGGTGGTIYNITFGIKGNFNWSNTAGQPTTSGSGTSKGFTFNGTGTLIAPQTLTYSGTSSTYYGGIYAVNTGTVVKLLTNTPIGATTVPYNTFTVNGTLDASTFTVSGGSATANAINTGFTLASGATLITANATGVQGSVTTAVKNFSSLANYEFKGAATGVFTTTPTALTVNNLVVNNATAVTLNQNITATNNLDFQAGLLTTGTFAVTVGASGTISNATSTKYVNGKLNHVYSAIGSKTFPIGKSGVYRPLSLEYTALTGISTVSAEQFETALTGTLPSANLNNARYWDISQTGGTGVAYKVTLDGTGDTVTGTVAMLKKESGTITSNAATTPNYTNTTAYSGMTGTVSHTLGSDCTAIADAGLDQTSVATCGVTTVTLAAVAPTYGTGLWSIVTGTGGSFGTASSATSTFTGVAGSTYTLQWTITNGNCTSNDQMTVLFNQNPTTATNGSTQTVCNLSGATLSGNAPSIGTGSWSVFSGPSSNTSQFSSVTNPTAIFTANGGVGTYVVRWTISNAPCTASTADANITISPIEIPTFTAVGPICYGTSMSLTTTSNNGYTGTWAPAFDNTATTTYTFTPNVGQCATTTTLSVIVNPNNAITNITAALNPICATATTTLTANGVAGTNAVLTWWTGINGTGTNLGNTATITVGPGTYYARVTGDCGAPQEANFIINAIAVPTYANLQYPGSGAICLGGSYDTYGQVYQAGITPGAGAGSGITAEFGYNATDTDPSTWTNWLATTYNVDSGNNDEYKNIFTPTTSGTYYYTFRYRQGTCDWIYGGYSVSGGGFWNGTTNVNGVLTVNPNPTASVAALNATICFNTDATFTLTGTSGAVVTYNINGASNTTATLTGGTATVTVANATATQTLYLVSVTIGTCTTSLSGSAVVSQGVATTWSAGAWDNGTPSSSTTTAIISSDYTTGVGLATGFTACSLIINTGAVVIVSSGDNITLNGGLTIQSGSFTLDNDANLIQNTTVTNTDNISVNRTTAALIRQDYALWSSPVAGQQLQAFSPMTLATRFYTYSPSGNIYVATSPTANFAASTGYLIRLPNNHPSTALSWTGTFTGVPNNGDQGLTNITSGLFYATGNPYPSAINANAFITSNSITEPLYFWRKTNNTTTSSYATYTTMGGVSNSPADPLGLTPNGYIQVGQGFIAKAANTSLNFTNSMRVSNSGPFLRTLENRSRIWLDLNGANGAFGQILVGYMPGATSGIDGAIDGRFFGDSQTALTSTINNEEFVIQGRAFPFETTDVVALGFKSELAGSYTISINHVDGLFETTNQNIYLKDNLTNTTTDLRAGSYTFATEAGVFNNRFEIVYAAPLAVNQNTFDANAIVVYHQNNQLVINTGKIMMANVAVYDISGRLIASKKNIKATETKINVGTTQQVLLVKITSTENGTVTKKVVN